MKARTYYNTLLEGMANVCDLTKELCVNCVGTVDDSIGFTTHSVRKDYYMMYVVGGSMSISFDDSENVINAGDLLIMRPGTEYIYHSEKGNEINYIWLHFTGRAAEKLLSDLSVPLNSICKCGAVSNISQMWEKMIYEFVINDDNFAGMTSCLLTEILICFSRRIKNITEKSYLLKSIVYIHENYHKNISIAQLASLENLSQSHFRATFTRIVGESPGEYITARRIQAAIDLLENTDKQLLEIATLVGYSDAYYFGRQFKKKMGVSPGKYRRNNERV